MIPRLQSTFGMKVLMGSRVRMRVIPLCMDSVLWDGDFLSNDCVETVMLYLFQEHGTHWHKQPRRTDGNLTALGHDQLAVTNMIWHGTHTNWFKYKGDTRLLCLRFPLRYRKMARDGVLIYLEKDGTMSMEEDQPPIYDKVKHVYKQEKVEKVIFHRYMLHTGLNIKSLIQYFGF